MDSGLKTRLIGAVVLFALAVIFVPMLLPNGGGGGNQANVNVPPEPSGELQTRVLQVGPNSAAAGASAQAAVSADPDHVATLDLEKHPHPNASAVASAAAAPPIEATTPAASAVVHPVATSAPATTVAKAAPKASNAAAYPMPPTSSSAVTRAYPMPPAASAPVAAAYPMPPVSSAPLAGGAGAAAGTLYTVGLGIYSDHASAEKLVAEAKQHGFTALASPETFKGKSVLRVEVGPYRSHAEAEAARLKLKDFVKVPMSVQGTVLNQTADAPASALPAAKAGSWAVQLAAYADEASANKLRDRVRALKFDGYVDSSKTAKGTWWRVRVGPFTSREVATEMRGRIADQLKIKGNIVTQE